MELNLADQLRKAITPAEWDLLQRIADAAAALRLPLYVVGGLPRDLVLGLPVSDFDLVVEGSAGSLAKRLAAKYGGKVVFHNRFGTAKWEEPEERRSSTHHRRTQSIDLVTARSELYKHPAALPTITPGTIDDDLRRRDFSINALAVRLDGRHLGEVRDDLGSLQDIHQGVVRVLHSRSFVDDPTRIYRAVRYEQRYQFAIAEGTLKLIPAARELVGKLSAQRIRHELDLVLDEPQAARMLERLETLGLLSAIHPALPFDDEVGRRLAAAATPTLVHIAEWPSHELRWILWLAGLPHAKITALNKRLHFHARLFEAMLAASELVAHLASLRGRAPSQWVERLEVVPLLTAYAVCMGCPPGAERTALEKYLAEWRHVKPGITGHDLKRMNVQPGAQYKHILGELRRAWLDGDVTNAHEEQAYLRQLLRRATGTAA